MQTVMVAGEQKQVFLRHEGDTLVAYVLGDEITCVGRFGAAHAEVVVATRHLTEAERAAREAACCTDEFLDGVEF